MIVDILIPINRLPCPPESNCYPDFWNNRFIPFSYGFITHVYMPTPEFSWATFILTQGGFQISSLQVPLLVLSFPYNLSIKESELLDL